MDKNIRPNTISHYQTPKYKYIIKVREGILVEKFILTLVVLFLLGFLYSFIIYRLSKSKILLLIPSITGIVLIIYIKMAPNLTVPLGLESVGALNLLIKELTISSLILGNVSGAIFLILADLHKFL